MRITKLMRPRLPRYREFEVPLAPGLTIVHGPNEAGKTTIQRALELVLTRKATAGGIEMDSLRSWDAPEDARPVIAIDFEIDDDDNGGGSRPGSVVKEFRGQRGTVQLDLDGQVITDPTLADQALAELTGIPSEAFFRSTASIRHHELADLDRDEATLRDRLQASISGADRGTSRAKRQLERASTSSRRRVRRTPAGSRRWRTTWPGSAASSSRARSPWPSSSATATRSPGRRSDAPRARRTSWSGGVSSRRPARPSG